MSEGTYDVTKMLAEAMMLATKYANAQVGWQTRQTIEALQDLNQAREALRKSLLALASSDPLAYRKPNFKGERND